MAVSYFLWTLILFCLVWAGLWLARWAGHLQDRQYLTVCQLAGLEDRRHALTESSRALQQMEIDPEVLALLNSALLDDLRNILRLDPSRQDLNRQIQAAEAASKTRGGAGSASSSAAVATEEELVMTQRHIQRALQAFVDLYHTQRISATVFQTAKEKLRLLGIQMAVNSCLLMAQKAGEQEDTMRAMACFRRAESLLNMRGMPIPDKPEKLSYINAERERLLTRSASGRGLLLMAGSD